MNSAHYVCHGKSRFSICGVAGRTQGLGLEYMGSKDTCNPGQGTYPPGLSFFIVG